MDHFKTADFSKAFPFEGQEWKRPQSRIFISLGRGLEATCLIMHLGVYASYFCAQQGFREVEIHGGLFT